ncbi:hypothetical protein [Streptomyces sp. NPDC001139]
MLRLGDDALVLGQRLCAWITRAPLIERELTPSGAERPRSVAGLRRS